MTNHLLTNVFCLPDILQNNGVKTYLTKYKKLYSKFVFEFFVKPFQTFGFYLKTIAQITL